MRSDGGRDRFAEPICTLQSLLHRARDLPDALFNQSWSLANVGHSLTAIVEDADPERLVDACLERYLRENRPSSVAMATQAQRTAEITESAGG